MFRKAALLALVFAATHGLAARVTARQQVP